MKRFLKISGVILVVMCVIGASAFFYIDYKVGKMMAGMARQKELTEQANTKKDESVQIESSENQQQSEMDQVDVLGESPERQASADEAIQEGESLIEVRDEEAPTGAGKTATSSEGNAGKNEASVKDTVAENTAQSSTTQSSTSSESPAEKNTDEQTALPSENTEAVQDGENSDAQASTMTETGTETTQEETSEAIEEEVEEPVEETPSVEEVEEEVDWAEKAKAYDMAMSRLTSDQISRLYEMSNGGFTPEEKKEAKAMFYANFTAEEQEWILEMYRKYY